MSLQAVSKGGETQDSSALNLTRTATVTSLNVADVGDERVPVDRETQEVALDIQNAPGGDATGHSPPHMPSIRLLCIGVCEITDPQP